MAIRPAMKAIVFDMNETMLDMSALDPAFAEIFGGDGPQSRKQWFNQLLQLFMTASITGNYQNFDELADDSLQMLAALRGKELTSADWSVLKEAQSRIRAYPDVGPGLARLKEAGLTVATLTNSTEAGADRLLGNAGIRAYFDRLLSVDTVKRYKPGAEAYEYAARELDVNADEMILVAAHSWDIAGALAFGCRAGFVARPGKALSPVLRPDFETKDVASMAEAILSARAGVAE
ncbi:MAG: haloacid dehalogenase type II [Gemmatimonadales bacterium]